MATDLQQPEYLRADAPIEHRSEDRLGRVGLAEAIADQVIHRPPDRMRAALDTAERYATGELSNDDEF